MGYLPWIFGLDVDPGIRIRNRSGEPRQAEIQMTIIQSNPVLKGVGNVMNKLFK